MVLAPGWTLGIIILLIFIIIFFQLQQPESLDVLVPDIDDALVKQTVQVVGQMFQLLVLVIVVKWEYRHTVVDVESKAQAAVVDY